MNKLFEYEIRMPTTLKEIEELKAAASGLVIKDKLREQAEEWVKNQEVQAVYELLQRLEQLEAKMKLLEGQFDHFCRMANVKKPETGGF
jgi:transposase